MQEEVTGKTVALIVDGAKMSEQVFEKAVKKFLEEVQKSRQPKIYRGKQTLKQLAGQNAHLEAAAEAAHCEDHQKEAEYYRDNVIPAMAEVRKTADTLETIVDRKFWPFPVYSDLLFRV